MKRIALFVVLLCTMIFVGVEAQQVCSPLQADKKVVFYITPQGINNSNSDCVSRIAFDIQGIPHTSNRIDDVVLYNRGKEYHATDIDGVDFNRYFQWEDNGVISIEVDFPRCKKFAATDSVKFITVHGIFGEKLGKGASKVK